MDELKQEFLHPSADTKGSGKEREKVIGRRRLRVGESVLRASETIPLLEGKVKQFLPITFFKIEKQGEELEAP